MTVNDMGVMGVLVLIFIPTLHWVMTASVTHTPPAPLPTPRQWHQHRQEPKCAGNLIVLLDKLHLGKVHVNISLRKVLVGVVRLLRLHLAPRDTKAQSQLVHLQHQRLHRLLVLLLLLLQLVVVVVVLL